MSHSVLAWVFGIASVACLVLAAAPAQASGEGFYSYTDDQGGVHITNHPDDGRYSLLLQDTAAPAAEVRNRGDDTSSGLMGMRPFSTLIEQAARRSGVEKALLHAVVSVESGYNPNAVSKRGAVGLMQLMPDTARRYKVANAFDPAEILRAGAQYLADLLKLFDNDLKLALAAYNAGEASVLKFGKRVPPFPETAAYVPKVVDYYGRFRLAM
jgi:soluble lytic murein transglycosylase-like protein